MIVHKMTQKNKQNKQRGFSLLEVLIAIIILSIGLLGIAAMQVVGMKNNHSAYLRSQAALLSYDFADIVRSNKLQTKAGKFDAVNTGNLGFNTDSDCTDPNNTLGCDADKMAETDLVTWAININSTLPSGMAIVARNGDVYTVTISWLDDKSNTDSIGVNVNGDASDSTTDTLTYNNASGNNIIVIGNEVNFKQLAMSFEP